MIGCARPYPIPQDYKITVTYRKCVTENDEFQKAVWGPTNCKLVTENEK